jgi:hypothetical protein
MLILGIGLLLASSSTVLASLALLGALLLARHSDRLALAPMYGAGLLIVGELAQRSIELRGVGAIANGVISSRPAAVGLLAALGFCAAAAAAVAVTAAPGGSVALTAAGALATVVACAVCVLFAKRLLRAQGRR